MSTQLRIDLEGSVEARDLDCARVLRNAGDEWQDRAIALALQFFSQAGSRGALFEGARDFALLCGLKAPPSPNAWGAVTLLMARRGLIERTGEWNKSRDVRSHARMQPHWRIVR
jgi:hypothetical protein